MRRPDERFAALVTAEAAARSQRKRVLAALALAESRADAARALETILDIDARDADELLELPLCRFFA